MGDRQLIGVEELYQHLGDNALRIIDCRFNLSDPNAGRKNYEDSHIPGAAFADLNEDLAAPPGGGTGRHPLPPAETVAAFFGRLGIDPGTPVVVYDGSNGAMAARAWWMLRWLGHDDVRLLDGGFAAWGAQQYPVESGSVVFEEKQFVASPRNNWIVSTEELLQSGDAITSLNLLDARDQQRFRGELEPIDKVAGHIPGAKNMPFVDGLTTSGLWKSRAERRKLWRLHLGDDPSVASIAMCGSGVTACHLILSAADVGYREPRLYVGSWSEWIEDPGRPIGLGGG